MPAWFHQHGLASITLVLMKLDHVDAEAEARGQVSECRPKSCCHDPDLPPPKSPKSAITCHKITGTCTDCLQIPLSGTSSSRGGLRDAEYTQFEFSNVKFCDLQRIIFMAFGLSE